MQSAKQLVKDEVESGSEESDEAKAKEILSKRGAKQLKDGKPRNAARVLFDKPEAGGRPTNVYKELVTDADSGKTGTFVWYTTEDSQTIGRQPIVKINPRTEEEKPIGYEFTIPYDRKTVEELKSKAFSQTKFYHKDRSTRLSVAPEQF